MPLAEFNLGWLKHDWDDPRIADFQDNLDRVSDLATQASGYLWHMPPEEMEAGQLDPNGALGGDPRVASTLSLWRDVESLRAFVFRGVHGQFYRKGPEWFEPTPGPRLVMWWHDDAAPPTLDHAVQRLNHLRQHGDTPWAFGWSGAARHAQTRGAAQ